MPTNPPAKKLNTDGTSGADMAKILAAKAAVTILTIVGVGVVSHVLEKKFGKDES